MSTEGGQEGLPGSVPQEQMSAERPSQVPQPTAREGLFARLKSLFRMKGNASQPSRSSEQTRNPGDVSNPIKIIEPPNPLSPFSKAEPDPLPDRTPTGESSQS